MDKENPRQAKGVARAVRAVVIKTKLRITSIEGIIAEIRVADLETGEILRDDVMVSTWKHPYDIARQLLQAAVDESARLNEDCALDTLEEFAVGVACPRR